MATESLFSKWRSQSFDDLVGQEVVVHTLRNALTSGNPARAYLFCGPRGTGKTSTARILAKALNCEKGPTDKPCGQCSICRRIADGSCLDVTEIDAASNTQVEKIRDFIIDKVIFAPAEARYKVYIIDEVHKLSSASFNALLKTLEEPPAHVVFILATTHPHELLPTVLSRCQRHDFSRLTQVQIRNRLLYVAEQEKISLEQAAADVMARAADGSMRDALVSLEQASTFGSGEVTLESVGNLFGLSGIQAVSELFDYLLGGQARGALQLVNQLVSDGKDLGRFAREVIEQLRCLMLVSVKAMDAAALGVSEEAFAELEALRNKIPLSVVFRWLGEFMELQRKLRDSANSRLLWEMTVISLTVRELDSSPISLLQRLESLEAAVGSGHRAVAPSQPAPVAGRPVATGPVVTTPGPGVLGPGPVPPTTPVALPGSQPVRSSPAADAARVVYRQERAAAGSGRPVKVVSSEGRAAELGWASPGPSTSGGPRSAASTSSSRAAGASARASGSSAGGSEVVPGARNAAAASWNVTSSAGGSSAALPSSEPSSAKASVGYGNEDDNGVTSVVSSSGSNNRNPEPVQPLASQYAGNTNLAKPVYTDPKAFWSVFLPHVRGKEMRLYAVLVEGRCESLDDGVCMVVFPPGYGFHYNTAVKSSDVVERLLGEVNGATMKVVFRLADETESSVVPDGNHASFVAKAKGLFAGQVVLEV